MQNVSMISYYTSGVETQIAEASIREIDLGQEIQSVETIETEGTAEKRAGRSAAETGTGTVKGIGGGAAQRTGEGVGHGTEEDTVEVAIEALRP